MRDVIGPATTDQIDVWMVPADTNDLNIFTAGGTVSNTGNGDFLFQGPVTGGSYYIVLHHRNSLETWSSSPVLVNNDTITYDFTTAVTKAYGSRLKAMGNNKFAVYSGDIDQDGDIDSTDQTQLENALQTFMTGYTVWDLTGDNFTETADFSMIENNAFGNIRCSRPPGR